MKRMFTLARILSVIVILRNILFVTCELDKVNRAGLK